MENFEYLRNREHKTIDEIEKNQEKFLENISYEYDKALEDIEKEINRNFLKYSKDNLLTISELMKKADKFDVVKFNEKVKKYIEREEFDKSVDDIILMSFMSLYSLKMRVSRLEFMKAKIEFEVNKLTNRLKSKYEKQLKKETIDEYKRQSGMFEPHINYNAETIDKIVNRNFHNATFSQRLWGNGESLKSVINTTVNRLILQGVHPDKMISELRKLFGVSYSEARRVLITESARVQGDVQLDSIEQAGFKSYVYIAERRACVICGSLNGKVFLVKDKEIGLNMYPMHPNCRCRIAPYEDED